MVLIIFQRVTILMAAFMVLFSCGDYSDANVKVKSKDTIDLPAEMLQKIHPFQYEGKKEDSLSWKDKDGDHYFIVSVDNHGEFLTEGWTSTIHGNLYTKTGTGNRKDWEIHDNASTGQAMIYVSESLKVKDVDGDGKDEIWFLYYFGEDGADPVSEKMILYTNGSQLTIKGSIPRMISDLDSYAQHMEEQEQVNEKIKAFAWKEWERNAIKEVKFYNGNEVTEEEGYPFKKDEN